MLTSYEEYSLFKNGDYLSEDIDDVVGLWTKKRNTMKGSQMKKGTNVSWLAEGATIRGYGVTISDEENGHILVAVNGGILENIPKAYHMVIYCTVTWLTIE